MPTIDAAVGGASSNSYSTAAAADTYFDERVQSANWTGESDADVKARALITATRQLDTLNFRGYKNSTTQALEWPRQDVFDRDGEEYSTTAIPTVIVQAMYEIAIDLLNANADSVDRLANDGLERFNRAKIGPLEVEPNHGRRSGAVPDHVLRMLSHLLESSGMMATLERS